MIELALPAGSLANALAAFSSGADAVYFGMKDFSARKGAVNFSTEDLSKIKRYCQDREKKFYVTVNTLVDDSETEKINSLLSTLDFYQPDGVIVQDLGIVQIMRKYYPSLPLHGSTQLAVHTSEGVRELQDLGFERVVLSRELTLDEIAGIRSSCPDIELKVFIHGALCYGFSGLCMASANVCGRSANRGECAQVCRSWFTNGSDGRNGYFFSLEDLCAGENLKELDRMGIESAKIEGRLKGDGYIRALTRYYRAILDGDDASSLLEDVKTSFSRKSGDGYFHYRKNRPSLLSGPPSHLGLECGHVVAQSQTTITVESDVVIKNRDGLQYFKTDARGLPVATGFSCQIVGKDGKRTVLKWGEKEDIVGTTVYKTSSSTSHSKVENTNIPLYRKPVDITVTVSDSMISASALGMTVEKTMAVQEARGGNNAEEQIRTIFMQSGESPYTLGTLVFRNTSSCSNPFIPLSFLKELRRDLYNRISTVRPEAKRLETLAPVKKKTTLPDRRMLEGDLPWSLDVKEIGGRKYITLPPVTFEEEKLFKNIGKLLEEEENLTVGLNNISQVRLAKRYPQHSYFADIYLYQSNGFVSQLLQEELGDSFIGGYLWIERKECTTSWTVEPTAVSYTAPSFISRSCFRHDSLGQDCTGCTRHHDYRIVQNGIWYDVKVRDCLTVVLKGSPE